MKIYIYAADVWCEACGEDIKKRINKEEFKPEGYPDETSYDSDEYPKGPYDAEKCGSPGHCASREECLDPWISPSGEKYGCFFENDITEEAKEYIKICHKKRPTELNQMWMDHYGLTPSYTNYYTHCGQDWETEADCMCNDECPVCGKEITPEAFEENK